MVRRKLVVKERNRDSEILRRLGEWEQRNAPLPQFSELQAKLLRLEVGLGSQLSSPQSGATKETASLQLREGLPLLGFDDLSLDWTLVRDQFHAVIDILEGHLTEGQAEAQGLRRLASNTPLLQQVVRDWYQGLSLSSVATEHCVTGTLLGAVVQATLRPFLVACSGGLGGLVNQEVWRRRHCPICGGKPDFASLDKEKGARWLLCSRCDAEWLFQRLECPYCGTHNQESLGYLSDDTELYRLYTCEECHCYIKAVDLRKAEADMLMPLERLMTVDLDRQAEEAGYSPG